jgi:LDH2 family malate/lactate/ureidoglycolate dehydrogenase
VKGLPRAAGVDEILMPGEPEERAERARRHTGVPLTDKVLAELQTEGTRAGISFPQWSSEPLQL